MNFHSRTAGSCKRRAFLKAQSSIEFLVILAVSMLAFSAVVFLASSKIQGIGFLTAEQNAKNAVELLADSAEDVFIQGNGAGKALLLKVPEGVSAERSGIIENSVFYFVSGKAFFKKLDFPVSGSLPPRSGVNVVRISSKNNAVNFSPSRILLGKNSFSVFLKKGSSLHETLSVKNYSNDNVLVSLKKQLSSDDISLSFSRSEFDLNSAGSESIQLVFSSKPTADGIHSGKILLTANFQGSIEVLEIPLFFQVSETGVLSVFPASISESIEAGRSYSKVLSICNNSQAIVSNISFSASQGQPGEWFSQVSAISELSPGCADVQAGFFVPANASGDYSGFLIFSDGFNTAGVELNLTVGGS